MENIEQTNTVDETVVVETVDKNTVSMEHVEDTYKAPESQEALEVLLKAAANKAKTSILKEDLGINSVKEFKELQASVNAKDDQYKNIDSEREEYTTKLNTLKDEYNSLKKESVLDKLKVKPEYREDFIKMASLNSNDSKDINDFETFISDMVNGRYKYAVSNSSEVKLGTAKTENKTFSMDTTNFKEYEEARKNGFKK